MSPDIVHSTVDRVVDANPKSAAKHAVAESVAARRVEEAGLPGTVDVVHDMLARTVSRFAGRPAVDFLGRSWTYGDVARDVDRVAAGLQALGVVKGDRVGLCLPNTPFCVVAYYAALKAGAIVVNFNPLYVARELEHQMRDAGISVMFVIDLAEIHAKVAEAAERSGVRTLVCCRLASVLPRTKGLLYRALKNKMQARLPAGDRHLEWAALIEGGRGFSPVAVASGDPALLQYTGGTTGTPKGAVLTHANIVANTEQVRLHDLSAVAGEDRVLGVLPLFHVFAMTVVMNWAVQTGAEMILLPRYDIESTMKAILRRKPTSLPAVPTIYGAIAKSAEAKRADLSFVKLCISGGAPLPRETAATFERVTGATLVEGYGLTEASPVVACNPSDGSGKPGSIGLPLAQTIVEIRDPVTREPVGPGVKGELVIRGPQVMRGYWNKPAETAAVLDEHGLRTGDIGYKDEDGFIFLVDRIKDIILSGGYNVYPRTIEDALYQHPDVREAIAIGIPDEYRGQSAKAFVVLRDGAAATPADLGSFLEGYLSKIERPKVIEIRDQLPKTAVGKLSRKELVEEEDAKRSRAAAA